MNRPLGSPLTVSPAEPYDGALYSAAELPSAVERMVQAEGWRAALALETAHWDRLIGTDPEALLAALKALPGEAYVEIPSLLVATNYLKHLIGDTDPRRFHDFAHDEHGRSSSERGPLDQLIGSAGRTAGLRTNGRLAEALHQAKDGRRTLDELPAEERAHVQMAVPHLLTQWGRAFEVNDAGGVREYEEAWELANLTGQPLAARRAAACLAWLHADHGELQQADLWIHRARSITPVPRYDAPLHLAAALTAIDRLDRAAMRHHLGELQQVPIGEYWAAELWVRAWAAGTTQEAALVDKRVNAMLRRHPERFATGGSFQRYLAAASVRLAATRGRPLPQSPAEPPTTLDRMIAASTGYLAGDMQVVLREAAPAAEDPVPRMRVAGLLLVAAARFALGRVDGASDAFMSAHAIIEDERFLSAYVVIDPQHLHGLAELTGLAVPETAQLHPTTAASSSSVVLATLTRREREILVLLASGLSLKGIATELYISLNTVKGVTSSLYRKLGVNSRREAADFAHRAGLH